MSATLQPSLQALFCFSHELGHHDQPLAILAEGNTSVKVNARKFSGQGEEARLRVLKM